MSDSTVQLPPNSSGQQIRVEIGDGATSQIPAGVGEEAVILTDAQGLFAGDARQLAGNVNLVGPMLEAILSELEQIKWLLVDGFDSNLQIPEGGPQ